MRHNISSVQLSSINNNSSNNLNEPDEAENEHKVEMLDSFRHIV